MTHYICRGGCGGTLEEMGVCESEKCKNQWEMMEECVCSDERQGASSDLVVKDSNGTVLKDGDSVVLVKDLPLRGTSRVYKRGTKVSSIRLTDDPDEVDCKIEGSAIVLRTEFLKKV